MIEELQDYLAKEFDIHFSDPRLLAEAFTQASYVNEHPHQNLSFTNESNSLAMPCWN
jgi:dsRNA-specific ribonuclease